MRNDMVVLIDTNVIIDFLLDRPPFGQVASEIIQKCSKKEITGYLALHTISNLWYILRKIPEDKRREWLMDLCSFLHVTGVNHGEVIKALANKDFRDFEDCLQDRCAKGVNAHYIITRNIGDFAGSDVPAVLPENFLESLKRL